MRSSWKAKLQTISKFSVFLLTKKDFRDEVFFDIYENHESLRNSRLWIVHGIRVERRLPLTTQVNLM
jgi:hypothetical protein